MRYRTFKLNAILFGLVYSLAAGFPAVADDTEIFFGTTTPGANNGAYPNVLFILDTSGSMRTEVGDTNRTRMQHMQDALDIILQNATDLNVGLMRFNDPGGPVLYPTAYIDADINTVTPTTPDTTVTSRVSYSEDDAEELIDSVDISSRRLEVVYVGGESGTYSGRIEADGDDAEEDLTNNNILVNGQTININNSQINGFRFRNTGIPKGANINSASLSFTAKADSDSAVAMRIFGELSNDASRFRNIDSNISNRTQTTDSVLWTPEAWTRNTEYASTDISSVVQQIVDQSGWLEDDLVILQTFDDSGSGEREAYTYRSNSARAAKLDVAYTVGTPGKQTIGLRFRDIGVPQGATITSAVLEFTAAQSSSGTYDTGLTVQGFDDDNTEAFSESATNITGRTGTTATVNWQPSAWTDGDVVQTPDISDVVQEIVDRSGWCGNNAMGFRISGLDLVNRVAHSYDGNPEFAPVLRVTYDDTDLTDSEGCMNRSLVYRINASRNDAEQTSNSRVSTTGDVFNMEDGQTNGLRFPNVLINQGATILEATLEFTAQSSATASTTLIFKAEADDNANGFVNSNSNISSRTTTSASVSWSPGDWTRNNTYVTPDLKSIIQEVVNRDTWEPGNALAIIQTASSGGRNAYTFDNQPADAALLRIKVQSGGVAQAAGVKVRDKLREIVSEFVPSGYTPIVDTLYEAANYYRGGPVLYGKSRGAQTTYGRLSHADSYTGGTISRADGCTVDNLNSSACASEEITGSPVYTTPIVDACQTSHIVLLTDGEANHNHSESLIRSMTSSTCTSSGAGEACGRELVNFLANTDNNTATDMDGDQNVTTYTIGFNLDEGGQQNAIDFLQDLADEGDGNYYPASTSDELAAVFQNIIRSIMNTDTTFVSPGATVNQFNRLTHQNDIYFSLFKPEDTPRWSGNLKRYELKGLPAEIVDVNDNPAVDTSTGFFKSTAKSFWSDAVDGNHVAEGGAAGELVLEGRNVYTYTGTSSNLSAASNALSDTNALITKTMLGIETATDGERTNLLKWAQGEDVDNEDDDTSTNIRKHMGAPLHSRAVVITYGGTEAAPDNVIFFGTNEGYLHAIDADDGSEVFSFVPQELLPNLNTYYENQVGTNLPYGLDGAISYWVNDVNGDHIIDSVDGDFVYLYVGMRRGGRNYYALDVTNRNAPVLKWVIKGGDEGFEELGQSWSRMVKTKVKVGSDIKDVLIFSGGYDPDQDDKETRSADTQGRAIYMVDADTGALVWSGGPTTEANGTPIQTYADMNYSIASDVRVIDVNRDRLADQMYVGDMGGQLWRFDIANGNSAGQLVGGGVIADLALNASDTNDAANNRRFYYPPDIAIGRKGSQRFLTISIGSGYRAHPLNTTIQDRFYMLRHADIYTAPSSYTKLTPSDFYDATDNVIGTGTASEQADAQTELWTNHKGWYIDLNSNGEKVLAAALTFDYQIIFTTYEPTDSGSACSAGSGQGRVYAVNLLDATPALLNADGTVSTSRYTELDRNGIPPTATVFVPDDGVSDPQPVTYVGAERIKTRQPGDMHKRTFWRDLSNN
ncbi:MAG: PilC/PilY family type IV pilus protein [Gammaproteobacteria bacterium]